MCAHDFERQGICWKDGSFSFAEAAHTQVLRCVSMEITNLNETVKRMCF